MKFRIILPILTEILVIVFYVCEIKPAASSQSPTLYTQYGTFALPAQAGKEHMDVEKIGNSMVTAKYSTVMSVVPHIIHTDPLLKIIYSIYKNGKYKSYENPREGLLQLEIDLNVYDKILSGHFSADLATARFQKADYLNLIELLLKSE